ncbi:MAG: hypothetical protein ACT4OS_05500 [Acidimicrobiales bacterium]
MGSPGRSFAGNGSGHLNSVVLADLLIRDHTDSTGRLLLEDAAPKRARRQIHKAGIPMKAVPSPYRDTPSRQGALINQPAYEALRQDLAEVLAGFAWLGENYRTRSPVTPGTTRWMFDVANLGLSLPLLLFLRAERPYRVQGHLPSGVASLFKASRGVFSVAVDLLNRFGPPAPLTAAGVVAFADDHGHLRGAETDRACAAPTRLIERTLEVVLATTDPRLEGASRGALQEEASHWPMADDVDFGSLWGFYRAQDRLGEALSRHRHAFGPGLAPASAGPGRRSEQDQAEEDLARVCTRVQVEINRSLGRPDGATVVEREDLAALL